MFEYINPADIHRVWFHVKHGLEVILDRTNETWLPEDVYTAIKTGQAQLFMFEGGFTVLQSVRDQYTNEPILHIWAAYHGQNDDGTLADVTDIFHSELRKIAHNIGSKRITFNSPRRWERRSGATLKSYNYEMEV
jgi:hypothetical protein